MANCSFSFSQKGAGTIFTVPLKQVSIKFYEGFLDTPFESIILVDANGIVRFVNNSYADVYSRKREDIIECYILDVALERLLPEVTKSDKVIMRRSRILEDKNRLLSDFLCEEKGNQLVPQVRWFLCHQKLCRI